MNGNNPIEEFDKDKAFGMTSLADFVSYYSMHNEPLSDEDAKEFSYNLSKQLLG